MKFVENFILTQPNDCHFVIFPKFTFVCLCLFNVTINKKTNITLMI